MIEYLNKKKLRQRIRAKILELPPEQSEWLGRLLAKRLEKSLHVFPGQKIGFFASDHTEIPTENSFRSLIGMGAEVFFPRVQEESLTFFRVKSWNQLERGAYGILEPFLGRPLPASELNFIFVPGVAFGPSGERLGRGGGFYDRLLSELPSTRTIGVSYELQFRPEIPLEVHDRKVSALLTESNFRLFDRARESRRKSVR